MSKKNSRKNWALVKEKLAVLDRSEMIDLVRDLYDASKDNQAFLRTRFGVGEEPLEPYKKIINRWTQPNVYRGQDISVANAKQAIADYRKASNNPHGLVELMILFCSNGSHFCADYGDDDPVLRNALLRMFGQALGVIASLPQAEQDQYLVRLHEVREVCNRFGYGVSDSMEDMLVTFEDATGRSSEDVETEPDWPEPPDT